MTNISASLFNKGFTIIVIVICNYVIFYYFYSLKCYNIICQCSRYSFLRSINNDIFIIKNGRELWRYLLQNNKEQICNFFMKYSKFDLNKSYYYHRIYDNIVNISVNDKFPDNSYYRLIPKNKRNFRNVLSHTYEVQEFLFAYQHPLTCDNKKFLILRGFGSGHGSELHILTSYLALAISLSRIAILDPYFNIMKGYGDFCKKFNNWLCFLEQLTNCSLSREIYKNVMRFEYENQTDKYLYVGGTLKYRNIIPKQIIDIAKYSPISKKNLIHYWRIQASTYIFRLNDQTNIEVERIIDKSLKHKLYNGCFNMWIRHGDKYKEMQLLNVDDYLPSYELYSKIIGKYIPIYLSTDDPNVTRYYDNIKLTNIYYLKFSRNNGDLNANMKRGAEMTLNFIADIKAALYCDSFSGTRSSNVVRLIDELRSTVGLSANSFYFENGGIKLSNTSYEHIEYW